MVSADGHRTQQRLHDACAWMTLHICMQARLLPRQHRRASAPASTSRCAAQTATRTAIGAAPAAQTLTSSVRGPAPAMKSPPPPPAARRMRAAPKRSLCVAAAVASRTSSQCAHAARQAAAAPATQLRRLQAQLARRRIRRCLRGAAPRRRCAAAANASRLRKRRAAAASLAPPAMAMAAAVVAAAAAAASRPAQNASASAAARANGGLCAAPMARHTTTPASLAARGQSPRLRGHALRVATAAPAVRSLGVAQAERRAASARCSMILSAAKMARCASKANLLREPENCCCPSLPFDHAGCAGGQVQAVAYHGQLVQALVIVSSRIPHQPQHQAANSSLMSHRS